MKIALGSDLHLELGSLELKNTQEAEVLILSGDIVVADTWDKLDKHESTKHSVAQMFNNFFEQMSREFPRVIYIAGNHEFYHGKWPGHLDILRQKAGQWGNVHFLENDTVKIGDVTFVGCTLWTDMNNGDALTMYHLSHGMNDFRIIKNNEKGYTPVRPAHVMEAHLKSKQYISKVTEGKYDEKFVVVTHHAPTKLSVKPRYKDDHLMNGGYSSDLSEFILDRPQIKVWTHGHTHDGFDYMVGSTRVVCNPRGYIGYEDQATGFDFKYMEV